MFCVIIGVLLDGRIYTDMSKPILNQQDRDRVNQRELGYIAEYLLERNLPSRHDLVLDLMGKVDLYLKNQQLALDVDDHTLKLKGLLARLVAQKKADQLQAVLDTWAAEYPSAAAKAEKQTVESRRQHAAQPHGIYRGLTEQGKIDYTAWGEDLDILVALRNVITKHPKEINADGDYILTPVGNKAEMDAKLKEFCAVHPNFNGDLLVPFNKGQNHWQLAIIPMKNGKMADFSIWDSIKVGIQKNGYSCMDYVIRQALTIKFRGQAPEQDLQTIIDAPDAQTLREAVVGRIINVHDKMQGNAQLQQSVRAQVKQRPQAEKLIAIDADQEDQVHAVLIQDKAMQEEFDGIMSRQLLALFKADDNVSDKIATNQARKFAYHQLLTKYGIFTPATKSVDNKPQVQTALTA